MFTSCDSVTQLVDASMIQKRLDKLRQIRLIILDKATLKQLESGADWPRPGGVSPSSFLPFPTFQGPIPESILSLASPS